MKLGLEEICTALELPIRCGTVYGVSTDTRTIKPGDLFVALKGESFDGNRFVTDALKAGAAFCICSDAELEGEKVACVRDTLDAYMRIAGLWRSKFDIPIVGVTGSSGKTTTRCMVKAVTESRFSTLSTTGNLNNEIGVSQMLLKIDNSINAAVLEMGMNHFGELERISLAAQPTVGIINNIGTAHIENLGSREGILKAKLEITAGMKRGSRLIVNGDDDMLGSLKSDKFEIVRFGTVNADCEFKGTDIEMTEECSRFTAIYGNKKVRCTVPAPGIHNVSNALCAIAAGVSLGIELEAACEAIACTQIEGRRQKRVDIGGITVIEDCYNANPESVRASLNSLSMMKCNRKIAVLGDMLELGEYAGEAHVASGREAVHAGVNILFTYGELSRYTALEAKRLGVAEVHEFSDKQALAEALAKTLVPGDAVLFKGSHSMHLEDVIELLYKTLEGV